jgi:hypothetical protein
MSNGLGSGFFGLTLLAVLVGLALVGVLATGVAYATHRRGSPMPAPLRYLFPAVGAGVLGVTGFAVLVMFDEAPALAGLFTLVAFAPFVIVGGYLARTTDLGRVKVFTLTTMAWGLPFLLGVFVAFGSMNGLTSALGVSPAGSEDLAWVASAIGGLTIVVGMLLLKTRLEAVVRVANGPHEARKTA